METSNFWLAEPVRRLAEVSQDKLTTQDQLTLLLGHPLTPEEYHGWKVLDRLVVAAFSGSYAYGLATEESDVNLVLVVCPPPENTFGLSVFEGSDRKDEQLDLKVYALRKLFQMLAKGNPNVLELLFLPEGYYLGGPPFEKLREHRHLFVTKQALTAACGYAASHLARLEPGKATPGEGAAHRDRVEQFGYDPRAAVHALRVLAMARELLTSGEMNVNRNGWDAEILMDIKQGRSSLEGVRSRGEVLFAEVNALREESTLPDRPDEREVTAILMELTIQAWVDQGSLCTGIAIRRPGTKRAPI